MPHPNSADAPQTAPAGELLFLDQASIALVTRSLRGIDSANVRFYKTSPEAEAEIMALLLALEVPAETSRIDRIAPVPTRRFSFQYTGRKAIITVSSDRPLMG